MNMLAKADKKRFRFALFVSFILVLVTWSAWILGECAGDDLSMLGIRPREAGGVFGIFLSSFIHGNFMHLFSNTLPLFILTVLATYAYRGLFLKVFFLITVLGGASVWMIAKAGTSHIGASGLIYGLASFLFFSGILRWETRQLIISALVVFLYGSFIWGVLPMEPGISWEGHLSGAVAGMFLAFHFRKSPSWPAEPAHSQSEERPSWEPEVFEHEIRQQARIHLPDDPHYLKSRSKVKTAVFRGPDSVQRH